MNLSLRKLLIEFIIIFNKIFKIFFPKFYYEFMWNVATLAGRKRMIFKIFHSIIMIHNIGLIIRFFLLYLYKYQNHDIFSCFLFHKLFSGFYLITAAILLLSLYTFMIELFIIYELYVPFNTEFNLMRKFNDLFTVSYTLISYMKRKTSQSRMKTFYETFSNISPYAKMIDVQKYVKLIEISQFLYSATLFLLGKHYIYVLL